MPRSLDQWTTERRRQKSSTLVVDNNSKATLTFWGSVTTWFVNRIQTARDQRSCEAELRRTASRLARVYKKNYTMTSSLAVFSLEAGLLTVLKTSDRYRLRHGIILPLYNPTFRRVRVSYVVRIVSYLHMRIRGPEGISSICVSYTWLVSLLTTSSFAPLRYQLLRSDVRSITELPSRKIFPRSIVIS